MKASNKTFTLLFLITAALFTTACGSSSTDSSYDFSSRTPVDNSSDSTSGANQYVATCNAGLKADLGAKLKMYVDKSGQYRMDLVQVRFTSLPSDFETNGSYLAFWKWLAQSNGSTHLAKYALSFMVIDPQSGQSLTTWKTTLKWDDVKSRAASLGMNSASAFMKRAVILVDVQSKEDVYKVTDYDALKIVSYTTSTAAIALEMDMLLPPFHANPADYAKESNGAARPQVLQKLHPLKGFMNQGYTSAQLLETTKTFCF